MSELKKAINTISSLIDANEKLVLPIFAAKLARKLSEYPDDVTLGMMNNVVEKMSGTNKLFISRAEVQDLYQKLYTRGNKFASLFAEELGNKEQEEVAPNQITQTYDTDIVSEAYSSVVDPILSNALDEAFGGEARPYTDKAKKRAESLCTSVLCIQGVDLEVKALYGNNGLIICNASFHTPKGTTNVLVPVEIENQVAVVPEVFVGNNGVEDLNAKTVQAYVVGNQGQSVKVSALEVFKTLSFHKNSSDLTDVDLAIMKINSKKGSDSMSLGPSIVGQEIEVANKNLIVDEMVFEDPEISSFAKHFDGELGSAKFKFGSSVNTGKNFISRMLKSFGFESHQISLASTNDAGVTYAVSLNGGTVGFKVPVKMSSENIEIPEVFVAGGSVRDFDEENVQEVVSLSLGDMQAAAIASPVYDLKSSELVEIVRSAAKEDNLSKAEDAINVLAQKGDEKAYQTALAIFTKLLNPSNKVAEENASKCSMAIKTANSQYHICSHTNLPLHKVYQDKSGQCRPLSSRASEDSYDGAMFMNSKIFF